jgi:hydroxybutyrate-dimer hydrolase
VIAAGISNGGGVVLRALEVDRGPPQTRWFDGAVAIEPSVAVRGAGRPLYDYATLASLLQPCAVLAEPDTGVPALAVGAAARAPLEAWCADLAAAGDVSGTDTAARAADARQRLLAAGFGPESLALGALNVATQLWPAIGATYAAALSRAAPGAMPCGLGFAYVGAAGAPRAATDVEWARLYADSNGIPPTGGVALLRQGPDALSVAAAQLPGTARCLRRLFDGPRGRDAALARGLAEIEVEGSAGARPVVVVHGRADSLVLPVHSSRPWVAAALRAAGPGGELRYYELVHAQHFDAFIGLPGMASRYVPTQPWLLAAMDRVHARLSGGAALPPSQVLRARPGQPFGGFPQRPQRDDLIVLRGRTLSVPE